MNSHLLLSPSRQDQHSFTIGKLSPLEQAMIGRKSDTQSHTELSCEGQLPPNQQSVHFGQKDDWNPDDVFYSDESNQLKAAASYLSSEVQQIKQVWRLGQKEERRLNQMEKRAIQDSEGTVLDSQKREKGSGQGKTNRCFTRNMLQFFWRVVDSYLKGKGKKDNKIRQAWLDISKMKPSLPAFTMLFNKAALRESLAEMFITGYLRRAITHSGINLLLKKCYIEQVDPMHEAYKAYKWNYIN